MTDGQSLDPALRSPAYHKVMLRQSGKCDYAMGITIKECVYLTYDYGRTVVIVRDIHLYLQGFTEEVSGVALKIFPKKAYREINEQE